jgi:acylphosphatase
MINLGPSLEGKQYGMATLYGLISGRVQGVGYRYFAMQTGSDLGI